MKRLRKDTRMYFNNFDLTKHTNIRYKSAIAVAMVLILAASAFASFPLANAHTPAWTVPTWAYISVGPNPIGVGQTALVVFWINTFPPTAQGAYGDRWHNYMVAVTKPDGSVVNLGPFNSDPVGSGYTTFKPDQPGIYKLVFSFPGQKVTGLPLYPGQNINQIQSAETVNDTYSASTSDPFYLNVTQAQVQNWPEAPLPTQYWTRPVNNMNRNWYPLLGNWLAGTAQRNGPTTNFGYGPATKSPHIMWAKPLWDGGTMDQRYGDIGYYTGLSYESFGLTPPIILNGRIYYNVMTPPRYGWWAIDLYTGEKLFFQNTTGPWQSNRAGDGSGYYTTGALSFGQVLNYDSPNQHGGIPYLWSTNTPVQGTQTPRNTWFMYDPFTGNYICSIANVTATGTQATGTDGSILYYSIVGSGTSRRLNVWNSTDALLNSHPEIGNWYWRYRPFLNYTHDGNKGYSLNITIPNVQGTIRTVLPDNKIIGGTTGSNDGTAIVQGNLWALNLDPKRGAVGSLLWNITFTPQSSMPGNQTISMGTISDEDGVFLFSSTQTRKWFGYSLSTGQLIWTTPSLESWNYYGMSGNVYQGKLLAYGYGGVLHAFNMTTGKEIWNYIAGDVGFESPYGNYPLSLGVIADGKIYLYSTEHSPTMPLWRGSYIRCIDATTGREDWKIAHFANGLAIADGYLVSLNLYDNRIYAYGKGPSATTVSAPDVAVQLGSSVVIKGTVTDQSPGAKGTPAISDANMEGWMEYLYEQQAIPSNAKGVPVRLTAIDPNGNLQEIGVVTSDTSGLYSTMWKPPVEGKYTITATFEGSNSYYSSYAKTAIGVDPAPSVRPQVTPAPTQKVVPTLTPVQTASPSPSPAVIPPTSGTSTTTYIAIGAAVIIIVAAAAALILKRRK